VLDSAELLMMHAQARKDVSILVFLLLILFLLLLLFLFLCLGEGCIANGRRGTESCGHAVLFHEAAVRICG
jgi:hypothetical protein